VATDARPLGDPAGQDVAAEILPGGRPVQLVGQPGNEPPVDGSVLRPGPLASTPAVRRPALDAPLLESLDIASDGAPADREPLGQGGVGDPGFVPPGLGDSVAAFGGTGRTAGSGQDGLAGRPVLQVGQRGVGDRGQRIGCGCRGRSGLRGGGHYGGVEGCWLKAPAEPIAQQLVHRPPAELHAGRPLDDHRDPGRCPPVAVKAVRLGALQERPFDRRQLPVGNRGMAAGATAA
jgi:hypothetical protein